MKPNIKAIETIYNGYRFRSRLEARWAVFFDALGIKYEYEKEGYDLRGIWYLPDFWLPGPGIFVEIKGEDPTPDERAKAAMLALAAGSHVVIFSGSTFPAVTPYVFFYMSWRHHFQILNENRHGSLVSRPEEHALRMESKIDFDRRGYVWGTYPSAADAGVGYEWTKVNETAKLDIVLFERPAAVLLAADAARQARFEHGETPRVRR